MESQLVKTRQFKFYKYLGDSVNAVEIFGKLEVDELIILNIGPNKPNIDEYSLLQTISERALMPITYGGHISEIQFAREIFLMGFDRIVIRRALKQEKLLGQLIDEFGSQAITAGIDVYQLKEDEFQINHEVKSTSQAVSYLLKIQEMGIGQVFLNYPDKDGMKTGLSKDNLVSGVLENLDVPIIISGGCRTKVEAIEYVSEYPKISVSASSIFTLMEPNDAVLIRY
jgi:cyclase